MRSRPVGGAQVCALLGVFAISVWVGMAGAVLRSASRRRCCPAWCPCRAEDDYLDSVGDGEFMSPPLSTWRNTMPIQRGDDS